MSGKAYTEFRHGIMLNSCLITWKNNDPTKMETLKYETGKTKFKVLCENKEYLNIAKVC